MPPPPAEEPRGMTAAKARKVRSTPVPRSRPPRASRRPSEEVFPPSPSRHPRHDDRDVAGRDPARRRAPSPATRRDSDRIARVVSVAHRVRRASRRRRDVPSRRAAHPRASLGGTNATRRACRLPVRSHRPHHPPLRSAGLQRGRGLGAADGGEPRGAADDTTSRGGGAGDCRGSAAGAADTRTLPRAGPAPGAFGSWVWRKTRVAEVDGGRVGAMDVEAGASGWTPRSTTSSRRDVDSSC